MMAYLHAPFHYQMQSDLLSFPLPLSVSHPLSPFHSFHSFSFLPEVFWAERARDNEGLCGLSALSPPRNHSSSVVRASLLVSFNTTNTSYKVKPDAAKRLRSDVC